MTENIYLTYYELFKSVPLLARKAIIMAYEETGNISEVARLFRTTRKTVRKVLRRWREGGDLLKWGHNLYFLFLPFYFFFISLIEGIIFGEDS
ncbi:MAG TPA: helix-turn-helix domain-containing protein [Candidatus Saccharicenans sp.]|nr:helix-turn-helix domain-containing protein [Candidatus Saccharicenans sp.]